MSSSLHFNQGLSKYFPLLAFHISKAAGQDFESPASVFALGDDSPNYYKFACYYNDIYSKQIIDIC